MAQTLQGRWQRLRINAAHLTAGGSWAVQLSDATQKNLRNFFFDGLFASASDSIVLTYLTLFLLSLGATSRDIGLMTALQSLFATLLLIPGAILVDRIGNRKKIVLFTAGYPSRMILFLLAILPWLMRGSPVIGVAIGLYVLMEGLRNFALPAWVSMSGDVVPLSWRGRYFSTRNLAMGFAAMVMIYGIGQVITWLGEPLGYQLALGLAFIFGITSTRFFGNIRDYRAEGQEIKPQSYSFRALFATLQQDRNFLLFCVFTMVWTFSLNIAGPFFNVFLVQELHATAGIIGVVSIVGRISAMPSQRFLGNLADRIGSRRLMQVMVLSIPALPFFWYFFQSPWQAIPVNMLGGILWAGFNLAAFNFLLDLSPQDQRARYSAMYQMAVALSAAGGAALGGFVADAWSIRFVFILSGIGRLAAGLLFTKFVRAPQREPIAFLAAPHLENQDES